MNKWSLNLPILESSQTSLSQFIDFWSKLYDESEEHLYNAVKKPHLDGKDIMDLFVWKNGMPLSTSKTVSLHQKVISKIDTINEYKTSPVIDLEVFLKEFEDISFVWKIFLLHIVKPMKYPVYDQHIHRCYNYIHGFDYKNISYTMPDKVKERFYFGSYYPFTVEMKGINLRKIDKAFFVFGQFLNTGKYAQLFD